MSSTRYNRQSSFALYSAENPGEPHSGATIDAEFNAVKLALDDTQQNLALIQDDDGALKRGSVGQAQFDSSVSIGFGAPSQWESGQIYTAEVNTVFYESIFYIANTTHTSGVSFEPAKWDAIADFSAAVAITDGSITSAKLADGAVTADKIGAGSISNAKLGTGAVSTAKIINDAVTTAKILDLNVTTSKINTDAVTYAKIQNVAASRLLGNPTGGAADPSEISLGSALEFSGSSVNLAAARRTLPTRQVFGSGSGTYTTPAGCLYIKVRLVGGGGGGGGSGTSAAGAGGAGGSTTFSTFTAGGGSGGTGGSTTSNNGGGGGSASGGALNLTGGVGGSTLVIGSAANAGGIGGGSPFFAGGTNVPSSPVSNSGAGGGGGSSGNIAGGSGGGSGGCVEGWINSPAASYSYAVGAGGALGVAGSGGGGSAGAAGAAGIIIVEEFYN